MFNNSSNIDASHSTFSEVHRDQYYSAQSTVQGNQTINTVIHGNQILQDSHSYLIATLQKASATSAAHDSAQRYPAPKCIEGTRIELLARLTSWIDEPSEKPICWLNGRPGSGKSAVSQTMAEMYASQKCLAASFFFSRRDLERSTTHHVVPTLTIQFLGFLPSIRPAVVAALENDYMLPMKVLREQMERLLLQPLSTATETPDAPLLIVVDALDECNDERLVSEFLNLLTLLLRKTSLPLRLLITSRPEPWLQSQFQQPNISSLTLSLDIHVFNPEEDIRSFLRHALDETYDQRLHVMRDVPRPWPSSEELECIVKKASGLFIFAFTAIKFVGDKLHDPIERLQVILEDKASVSDGSAYADLDLLYLDAISVFPDADVARLVLGVVYCMAVPLSILGLHKLLQRPGVDARIVIPVLGSILLASEDGKQPIQIYHASFRDFLVNPQRSQKYAINPDDYHELIAQLCFEIMSNSLKRDMCGIGDPAKANSEVLDLVERRQAAFDEALLYACRFWSCHLARLPNDGVANEALLGALKRFSTTVLLCWIEALSIFGELENAPSMLRWGIRWLKTLREVPKDTLALLEDADRLVVLYMDCITECPLHVYLTAISFLSTNSPIRQTYKHQSLMQVTLYPEQPDGWSSLRTHHNLHNPICSVVFSTDDDLIATAGIAQGVQVWNVITGKNVASLGDRQSTSLLVRFSPSGAFLAAAFEGSTVTVWDPKVGREHLKDEGCHGKPITCLEFSENSALLASGSRDHTIKVWSMETRQVLCHLATHEGPVTSLVFSGSSPRLFSGAEDNLIISWEIPTGKVVQGLMGHRGPVNCVAISKNGGILASGSEDKTIKIWDTGSGKCTHTFSKGHYTGIRSVHFFDEDKYVVAACDEAILSWDVSSRNTSGTIWALEPFARMTLKRFPMRRFNLMGLGLPRSILMFILHHKYTEPSTRRLTIAYASRSPSFVFSTIGVLWAGLLPFPLDGLPLGNIADLGAIAVSSEGNWAASADTQGLLQIYDLALPRKTWADLETSIRSNPIRHADSFVPSPNGTRFIIGNVKQWSLVDADYHIIKKLDLGVMASMLQDGHIRFKFSPDGSIFLCVSLSLFDDEKSTLRVFDSVTGEQHVQFKGLKKVQSFTSSAGGAWAACGHGSGEVELFRVASKGRTSLGKSDDSPINVLLFSDSAQELISGSSAGAVRIWDRASGACKATFGVSSSMVTSLAYADTRSGAWVAIGRGDGSLCLWSPSTSASHNILSGDHVTVKNVDFIRFSDDTSKLMTRGEDGSIFTWTLSFDADDARMERCALCTRGESTDDTPISKSLPHLLSRSDPEDVVDGFSNITYRIRKDNWLVKGDRRVIWVPPVLRPQGKDAFYAYENGQVVFRTPSTAVFLLKWNE